jgi:23S rRNA (uridine2552-2'-O)-methyltransferase
VDKDCRKVKRREDHYTKSARQKGYPARSVYKLEEIQRKFRLIHKGDRVLDIGASPGSWSLFAVRELRARVVAIDLQEPDNRLKEIPGITFLRGDLNDVGIGDALQKLGPYNVVISDAAPTTTGNRLVDTQRSYALTERVLELASVCLIQGGHLVMKIFQGGAEQELRERIKGNYRSVKAFKPRSSRKKSVETYLVGICKLAELKKMREFEEYT